MTRCDTPKLDSTGLEVSTLGCVSWATEASAALRADHRLRHRQHLLGWHQRGDHRSPHIGPLARCRLTRDWDAGTARAQTDDFGASFDRESDDEVVASVTAVAERLGIPRAQVALTYVLAAQLISA